MIEIERKFLVTSPAYQEQATSKERIVQGFLNTHPERTVRVRIKADSGFLTVKGKSNDAGTIRFEWEKEIPIFDAEQLLLICEPGVIDKVRYNVPVGQHIFEVDEFYGDNEGLVVAEVELREEEENFKKPEWLGKEVTGEVRYYNSQLGKKPFKSW
ncbi:CYTH domain-containing protein [Pseudozobellia thermophila]|uniref:CYTH domain-containing protein n=1 Tax=Pseudozobellia thermophila TaxID=192903 RepID=A0A1M6B150_9FLAO|nr:CYTH domain-containing protein [Pseudozobellia thermophila]SHI42421.1 CYTH domain-containing protein [Pseudozobellia thermophila]